MTCGEYSQQLQRNSALKTGTCNSNAKIRLVHCAAISGTAEFLSASVCVKMHPRRFQLQKNVPRVTIPVPDLPQREQVLRMRDLHVVTNVQTTHGHDDGVYNKAYTMYLAGPIECWHLPPISSQRKKVTSRPITDPSQINYRLFKT